MQQLIALPAELAEDLEVIAGTGQDAARCKQHLIDVTVPFHTGCTQSIGNLPITLGFVVPIFLIGMHVADTMFGTQTGEYRWHFTPVFRVPDQHRDIQRLQLQLELS